MRVADLLYRLQSGASCSIGELAQGLGVSCDAIEKTKDHLIEIGLPIVQDSTELISLATAVAPIDSDQIRQAVAILDPVFAQRISVFDEIDSTNQYLMTLPRDQLVHKQVCLAEYMTAGRGRQSRKWHGGAYQNILLSLAWQTDLNYRKLSGLSLAVAVIIVESLQSVCNAPFRLKWPNDILVFDRKLSGILIEIREDFVIIGIGINCELTSAQQVNIDQPVISLAQILGQPVNRNLLIPRLLDALARGLDQFTVAGLEAFRDTWSRLHAHHGMQVRTSGKPVRSGIVQGIDTNGALLLQLPDGEVVAINSGSLSVLS